MFLVENVKNTGGEDNSFALRLGLFDKWNNLGKRRQFNELGGIFLIFGRIYLKQFEMLV